MDLIGQEGARVLNIDLMVTRNILCMLDQNWSEETWCEREPHSDHQVRVGGKFEIVGTRLVNITSFSRERSS